VRAVFALLLSLAVVGIFWIAAEYHYDNCITAARADHGVKEDFERSLGKGRVTGCSRLPF